MSQNWESNDWWNRTPDEVRNPPQQQQQRTEESVTEPDPVSAIRQISREEHVRANQEYSEWARKRQEEYSGATAKFASDKDRAPYYEIAQKFFLQLDRESGQQLPVARLYDMTVAHVDSLRQMGVKPPAQPKPAGAMHTNSQPYDIPLHEQAPSNGNLPFRRLSEEEIRRNNEDYLFERQMDLDRRKFRGADDDFAKLEEMCKKSRDNRLGTLEKV